MKIDQATTMGSSVVPTPASPGRLHDAATQFEALLLKDLLRPMTEKSEDGDSDNPGALQGFAVESIAGSMARSGALGFAREIEQSLSRSRAHSFSAKL